MREDERAKKLQPFLEYLNQTPVGELLNDYTYQLIYIGRDPAEQLERLQYLKDKVTEPGSGISWRQFDVWCAGCAKRAADDPAAFYESADRWHDRHFGKPSAPVCLQDVKPQEIQWLVPDLIPLGEISLLGADGGTGKGFWAAQLVACVTAGKTSGFFPVPPAQTGRVLVLSGEDDPGNVLPTRFMAAGADMSKVQVMTAAQE
uniref:AAA family ATPase n=1 Tax=Faecalibacterium sp. TaxID=1971605 RepID=UPI004027604A